MSLSGTAPGPGGPAAPGAGRIRPTASPCPALPAAAGPGRSALTAAGFPSLAAHSGSALADHRAASRPLSSGARSSPAVPRAARQAAESGRAGDGTASGATDGRSIDLCVRHRAIDSGGPSLPRITFRI